jgi:Fic family protein
MIINHKGAIEYIIESASQNLITAHEVCSVHALLSENLLGDPGASGRLRNISVGISGSVYMPLENPHLLRECFQIFVNKYNQIKDPFEQSFFSLVHLSYMQAFEDVNKRTARLIANISIFRENLKPLSFTEVDRDAYTQALLGIYEKNDVSIMQDLYYWAYQRSAQRYSAIQQSMGEPNQFKLKYRNAVHDIIRKIILEKTIGSQLVSRSQELINLLNLSDSDAKALLRVVEDELINIHEGSIARFKIRPSEFQEWKKIQ